MTTHLKSAVFKNVEEISGEDCLEIARRKMKSVDVEVENVTMKTLGETPAGYGGDHYRLKITVRQNPNGNVRNDGDLFDLHFFVKTKPRDTAHCDFIDRIGVVKRELDFFSVLMGLLDKYVSYEERSANAQVPWTADCYLANMRLIVLDDLTHEGYRLIENRSVMDYDHCVVMFEALARFHASSLIYEELESQRRGSPFRFNEEFPGMFKENTWTYDPPGNAGKQISDAGINGLNTLINMMPELKQDPEKFAIVQNSVLNLFKDVNKLVEISTDVRNVITHGDLWANNILFKYDSSTAKPTAARIIDFQLLRYTAPAHDFLCALYLNTTPRFRRQHGQALAAVYHSTLAAELARHNLDVETIAPRHQFENSLEHYRMLGLLTACVYYPATLMPDDVASAVFADPVKLNKFMLVDQSEWSRLSFETDGFYRERLTEVVDELAVYVAGLRG